MTRDYLNAKNKEVIERRKACRKKAYSLAKDYLHIFGDGREASAVAMRRKLAKQLVALGYSYGDIGYAMNRHYSTICNLVCSKTRQSKRERYYIKKGSVYEHAL